MGKNNNSVKFLIISLSLSAFVVLSSTESQGSPHPALGASQIVSPERGLFLIPRGYQIQTAGVEFLPIESESPETFRYRHQKFKETLLSITIDQLKSPQSLESFSKKWSREYIQFGFKIRGTQYFDLNGERALVMDLDHIKSAKSLRQIVLIKNLKAAVITCTSPQEHFSNSLGDCNKMISTFTWTSDPRFLK